MRRRIVGFPKKFLGTLRALRFAYWMWGLAASGAITPVLYVYALSASGYWRAVPNEARIVVATGVLATLTALFALLVQSFFDWNGARKARSAELAHIEQEWQAGRLYQDPPGVAVVRAQADQNRQLRIEALRECISTTFDAVDHGRSGDGADRARGALRTLHGKVEALGQRTLGASYESIRKLEEELGRRVGITVLGPNADSLKEARAMKEAILNELDALLSA